MSSLLLGSLPLSLLPSLCCRRLNVPSKLLDALDQHKAEHSIEPLLIQLSTDQAGCSTSLLLNVEIDDMLSCCFAQHLD